MDELLPPKPEDWVFKYYWKTIKHSNQQFRVEVLAGVREYAMSFEIYGLTKANFSEPDEVRANDKCNAIIQQYVNLHGIDLASCECNEGTGKITCQWQNTGFLWIPIYTKT